MAHTTSFAGGKVAEKVEVQEALPPAGVLGAEPLSLMPQHFPREPAKRCFQTMAANQGGDTLTTSFAGGFDSEPGGGVRQVRQPCAARLSLRALPPGEPQASFLDGLRRSRRGCAVSKRQLAI